jgi:hypothetical protein
MENMGWFPSPSRGEGLGVRGNGLVFNRAVSSADSMVQYDLIPSPPAPLPGRERGEYYFPIL